MRKKLNSERGNRIDGSFYDISRESYDSKLL